MYAYYTALKRKDLLFSFLLSLLFSLASGAENFLGSSYTKVTFQSKGGFQCSTKKTGCRISMHANKNVFVGNYFFVAEKVENKQVNFLIFFHNKDFNQI